MTTIQTFNESDNGLVARPKLNTNFANVKADIEQAQSDITTLEGDVTTIEGNITTIESDITDLQNAPPASSLYVTVGFTDDCDYVCDGTDDQDQINTAIASLSNGGVVYLKGSQNYTISSPIVVSENITFRGESTTTVLITCIGDIVGISAEGDNITLEDFTLDADTNANNGIHKADTYDYFTMRRVKVINAGMNGVQATTGSYHKFIDNICLNNANANSAYLCAGINLDDCSYVEISQNTCSGNANAGERGAGIYCGESDFVHMRGNICYNNDYGLDVAKCFDSIAIGNSCYNNNVIGIDFSNGGQQNIISNNECTRNGNDGIRVWASDGTVNSQYVTITGNICDSNGTDDTGCAGIRISTAPTGTSVAQRMMINGNMCIERLGGSPRQQYGILSEQRSDYLAVNNNYCYNNATAGVSLVGSNNTVGTNPTL